MRPRRLETQGVATFAVRNHINQTSFPPSDLRAQTQTLQYIQNLDYSLDNKHFSIFIF